MPRKLKPGDIAGSYSIKREMNIGAMAIAYEAIDAAGQQVFLKLYKSPTVTKDWYRGYVNYQQTLKTRVEESTAKNFTYRFIDFFEHAIGAGQPTYFQAFEFVKGGDNLEEILDHVKHDKVPLKWEQRIIMAKVFIAGVAHLHKACIVHSDLKPANVQLFKDPHITAGYRLKIIDMDFSVLPDIKAPWHGDAGYVGSPNYFSPEHLKGQIPQTHSDVFTCGLILYELLAKIHPYASEDDEIYKKNALKGCPPPPNFDDAPSGELSENIAQIVAACLCPAPSDRPSAQDVLLVLNGRKSAAECLGDRPPPIDPERKRTPPPPPPVTTTEPAVTAHADIPAVPKTPSGSASRSRTGLILQHGERRLPLTITTVIGKHLVQQFGEDSRFFDEVQFTLLRSGDDWFVDPNTDAANETLLNGEMVTTKKALISGDILSVGRSSKNVSKLPLSIEIS